MGPESKTAYILTARVRGITPAGFWLGGGGPEWSGERDAFIPRSQILDCDEDLDEVEIGQEITVEIPLWLARKEGMAE